MVGNSLVARQVGEIAQVSDASSEALTGQVIHGARPGSGTLVGEAGVFGIDDINEVASPESAFLVAPVDVPAGGERIAPVRRVAACIEQHPGNRVLHCVTAAVGVLAKRTVEA